MNVELELALFEADHGDAAAALQMARATYERRPTVYAADVLAWAAYQAGELDQAAEAMERALRLHTQEPLFYYHAGLIAAARGETAEAAAYLEQALALNPAFDILAAGEAQATLAALGESRP